MTVVNRLSVTSKYSTIPGQRCRFINDINSWIGSRVIMAFRTQPITRINCDANIRHRLSRLHHGTLFEMQTTPIHHALVSLFLATLISNSAFAQAGKPIDFSRQIQPILSENCFFCHGPDANQRQSDLRLDVEADAEHVFQAGDAQSSALFSRISSDDADELMPPPDSNRQLTKQQIALIERWINEGGRWGQHWAYAPILRPDVAAENAIDFFISRKLKQNQLRFSPEADRATLIRRVCLDLTGLPPTIKQLDNFLADRSPDAYEKMVDRFLGSPAYGERMAWNWLDAARYADTNGYQGDNERTMWPWRDWVIQAYNDNMPFDQFSTWQLAGDLLPNATDTQILATGFNRNHPINGEGGRIPEENRVDYGMDMAETTGTVWMGLTFNCCRCHDHKYDRLTQNDYYSLFAFFDQTPITGGGGNAQTPPVLPVPSETQRKRKQNLERSIAELEDRRKALAESVDEPRFQEFKNQIKSAQEKLKSLNKQIPKVMVMADMHKPRKSFRLNRGSYRQPLNEVVARVPEMLQPLPENTKPNRLALAHWLFDKSNPLTPRVTVNRLWAQFFGVGIVKTTENLGVQGEPPSHPELLDWLASEYRDSGWDTKHMIRLILISRSYRQSSKTSLELQELDPENRLLGRSSRFRMPSWMIRDQALAASGQLISTIGGKPVNSYQPAGVWEESSFGKKKYKRGTGDELYRRSIYTFWRRIAAPTMIFDNADRMTCSVTTYRTNTPLHALNTLNDVTFVEASRLLATNILRMQLSESDSLNLIFNRVAARDSEPEEQTILLAALRRTKIQFQSDPESAEKLIANGESQPPADFDPINLASWTSLCLAIFNLDESLTRQ